MILLFPSGYLLPQVPFRGGRCSHEFRRPCLKSSAPLLERVRSPGRCFLVRAGSILWFAEQLARSSSGCHKPPVICFASVCRPARADPTKAVRHRHRRAPKTTFWVDNSRTESTVRSRLRKREDEATGLTLATANIPLWVCNGMIKQWRFIRWSMNEILRPVRFWRSITLNC